MLERIQIGLEEARSVIGMTLQGGYQVSELLGRSPRGTVYRATTEEGGGSAAVHVLQRAELDQPEAAEAAFRREALLRRAIDLPQVPGFLGAGRLPEGDPYFILEFVPGPDLATHLRRTGSEGAADLLQQALEGIGAIHSLGLLHRNIQATNLYVSTAGYLKIGGMKAGVDTPRLTSIPRGALPAPETFGGVWDARSDLYALGAAFYFALTRLQPFSGESLDEVLTGQMRGRPMPLTEVDPRISGAVERVIVRLLEADPARRYPSAEHALTDLDERPAGKSSNCSPLVPSFIGRESERLRVQALLRGAMEGLGASLLVSSVRGGGRTRFIQEVVRRCRARGIPAVIGRCVGPPPIPLGAVRELMSSALTVGGARNPEVLQRVLQNPPLELGEAPAWGWSWSEPAGHLVNSRLHRMEEILGGLVGEPGEARAGTGTPAAMMLILEDLHRADAATLEFFRFAARAIRGRRGVLLGTIRTDQGDEIGLERLQALRSELPLEAMELPPLTESEMERLIEEVASPGTLEQEWPATLIDSVRGNPRFGRLATFLAERESIQPDEFSLRSSILEAMKLTGEGSDLLLKVLTESPLGLSLQELAGLTGGEAGEAIRRVERWMNWGLVEAVGDRIRLAHDGDQDLLTGEAGPGDILPALLELVEVSQASDPTFPAIIAATLAQRAGNPEKAARRFLEAGDQARALGSGQEALEAYQQTLALLMGSDGPGEAGAEVRSLAMRRRVEILWHIGRTKEARQAVEDLLAAVNSETVLVPRDEIQELQARLLLADGEFNPAIDLLRRAVMGLGGSTDDRRRVHLLRALTRAYLEAGETEKSGESCVEALVICKRLDDDREVGWTLGLLGEIRAKVGDRDRARHCLEESSRLLEEVGDGFAVASADAMLGRLHFEAGEVGKAISRHLAALRGFQRLGWESKAASCSEALASDYLQSGRDREALRYFRLTLEARERLGEDTAALLARVGSLAYRVGDHAAAIDALKRALQAGTEGEEQASLLALLGASYSRRAVFERSIKLITDALEQFNQLQHPTGKIRALLLLAGIHLEIGAVDRGLRYLQTAEALGEDGQDRMIQMELLLSAAQGRLLAYQAGGLGAEKLDEALIALDQGIGIARDTGSEAEKFRGLRIMSEILVEGGDLPRALTHVTAILPWARRCGNRFVEADSLRILGEICFQGGEQEGAKALRCALESMEILEEHKRPEIEWRVRALVGRANLLQQDPEQARRYLAHSLKIIRAVSDALVDQELRRAYLRHQRRRQVFQEYKALRDD